MATGSKSMQVVVTGSTGLIGTALVRSLGAAGHGVRRLVRSREAALRDPDASYWSPSEGVLEASALEGADAVVHLAGENIASGRWTESRKARIRDSRIDGTRLVCERLANLDAKPRVLVSASGISYYGERGDDIVDESTAPGEGFLAEVCRAWEAATGPAAEAGIRVVLLRTGPVLSPEGGMLARLLPVFRMGLGGALGSGDQWLSWVTLDDHVRAIEHALAEPNLAGPVNSVTPEPVTNQELTDVLARVLHRPAVLRVPRPALELAFGRTMARETVLASQRVRPARLVDTGFEWKHPALEGALRDLLGR